MNPMLFDLAFGFLAQLLQDHKQKLPAELVTATQNAVDSWATHKDDVITAANIDAHRVPLDPDASAEPSKS